MQVQDIMSHPVITVKTSATIQHAAEMMALHNVGALPVTEDDILMGIVTDRDVVLRGLVEGLQPTAAEVQRIMTIEPVAVRPEAPVEEAAAIFRDLRIRRLPVVEDRHPVGMITVDDIARQWDNDQAILLMARRVAPRRKGAPAPAAR